MYSEPNELVCTSVCGWVGVYVKRVLKVKAICFLKAWRDDGVLVLSLFFYFPQFLQGTYVSLLTRYIRE